MTTPVKLTNVSHTLEEITRKKERKNLNEEEINREEHKRSSISRKDYPVRFIT